MFGYHSFRAPLSDPVFGSVAFIPLSPAVLAGIFKLSQENRKTNKKIIEPIIGQAIFNGIIVNYLCDGGADVTIIDEKLLEKLIGKNQTAIITYKRNQINSCSGKITIFGTVNVEECIIDPDIKLPEVQLIATNQIPNMNVFLDVI